MREIRFRAWDEVRNEWIDDCDLIMESSGMVFAGDINNPPMVKISPSNVSVFTGQNDMNEKPIYEGDIVDSGLNIGEVRWHWIKLTYVIDWRESFTHPLRQHRTRVKVIGNRFENPDLLEQTS